MSEYVFKLPDLGEGTVEAEIVEWHVKTGDTVAEDDVIVDVMTDKATVEVAAPVSGRIVSLTGTPGDMVPVGTALIVFETDAAVADAGSNDSDVAVAQAADKPGNGAAPPPAAPQAAPTPSAKPVATAAPAAPTVPAVAAAAGRVLTSPAIRRQAREAGIDLSQVPGSGPRGRIQRTDLETYVANRDVPARRRKASGADEIRVIGLRRIIAERMSAAKRTIPHFSYVEEVDITHLESLRQHLNGRKAANAPSMTYLPFLGMALVRALREFPQCNATYDDERKMIVQHHGVHLGVATQTPDGLKVPVVRHAEALSLVQLNAEIRRVSQAARDNSARREELTGSTITISSLGKLGGIASTPVINAPEVGVIGVNKAVQRPMVVDGQVVIRTMMNLSSSFDHRFVDGFDGAALIQHIRESLEEPAMIFIDD